MNPASRPAEWSGAVAGAVALLVGLILNLDTAAVGALAIVVGFIPAGVTGIVEWVRSNRNPGTPPKRTRRRTKPAA